MPQCTWLATYPKSGTTWTRFLVHELLAGPAARSSDLDRIIPSIHEEGDGWRDHLARGGLLATHKERGRHTERYGGEMHGFVHVVRHPADVLLSEARFFCLMQAGDVQRKEGSIDAARLDELFVQYLQVMMHGGQTDKHRRIGMGSWATHLVSWLDARAGQPHLFVRYEDLTTDPIAELARIAGFFRVDVDETELGRMVERCSADSLRRMEEREIASKHGGRFYRHAHQTAYEMGLRFVGTARVGEGLKLGSSARARIEAMFGDAMARVGYHADGVDEVPEELRESVPLANDVAVELRRRAPLPT